MAMMSCCYSKLEELEAELNSDMSFFGTKTEQETEQLQQLVAPDYYDDDQLLLGFDSNFFSSDTFLDHDPPLWEEKSNNCDSCQYNSLLPNYSYSTTTSSSPPEIFPAANNHCSYEFHDSYNNTMKRQKVYEEEESFLNYSDIDFVIPNMNTFFEEPTLSHGIFVGPFLDHFGSNPLTYYNNHYEAVEEKKPGGSGGDGGAGGGKNLSAQSIAARQRRRKITEKTQELGKLIPGGNRMNTADMFQAAYKYIKFLQAQVGILQILQETNGDSLMDNNNDQGITELLLGSTLIQEKLYSAEKCLVPKKLVDESLLPNHQKKLKLDTDDHHHHHHSSSL